MFEKIRKKLRWLDPFTYVDEFVLPAINPKKNETINWIVYLISAFVFAFIAYQLLGFLFGTVSPIVVVVSGSMEPSLHRGDVLFIVNAGPEGINAQEVELNLSSLKGVSYSEIAKSLGYENDSSKQTKAIEFFDGQRIELNTEGDIIVYNSFLKRKPIIHRAIAKLKVQDGTYYLTKGDNKITNTNVDEDCGEVINGIPAKPCIELYPLQQGQLNGKAVFMIPLIGYVKLLLVDDMLLLLSGCPKGQECIFP
ncbi:MAG: hypothetical protein ABIA76_03580 [Candidatus Diapherotrites archaeon]